MEFTLSISEKQNCVIVQVHQSITQDMVQRFAKEAIELANRHGLRQTLVDVRGVANLASAIANYKFAYQDVKRFGLGRDMRIAILADPDDSSHAFVETLFRNAGYECRLFVEKDAALAWLDRSG